MIYENMLKERQKLEIQLKEIQLQLETFPNGKLICAANGKGYKWYWSDGHKPVYLSKKERHLAEKLAHKKYLSLKYESMLQEKKAIDSYLTQSDRNAFQKEQSFINSPQYKELLTPVFTPLSEELFMRSIMAFIHAEHHGVYSCGASWRVFVWRTLKSRL